MDGRRELDRARSRLWIATFTIVASLATVLLYVSAGSSANPDPAFMPSRRLLGLGLGGMLVAFALYVLGTERKHRTLTDELIEQRLASERLQLAHAQQRDFVSMAAHELRAPLTAIKGFTRTLMVKFDQLDGERRNNYLAMVNDQSNRLAALVEDLMEVSRIDAGAVRLARSDIDARATVERIVEQFRGKWDGRFVRVVADAGLPPVSADPHKLDEILINLIDNAVKYSDEDVVVELSADAGSLQIAVRDRGDGIAPAELEQLFEKFVRLPAAAATDIPGTGLGLYIVRGLARAHGGDVDVVSTPGGGSTFTVRLPLVDASDASGVAVAS